MDVGKYIKFLRSKKGITQEELGRVVGVQRAAVQKWEAGKTKNLKRETIKKLSNYFNVNPINFIGESNIKNNLILSEHEEKVLVAYRSHPEMQEAVDRLLDIQETEKVTVFAAARSADSSYSAGDKEISKSVIEKLNKAPVTDDDL